jgi:hypothetical protein
MATDAEIERANDIINSRTEEINNLFIEWNENQNQNDDIYRQRFNTHTNNIIPIFEQFVDIINRIPDNRYVTLARNLYANLEWLLSNIYTILGDPNDVNDPRHQVRSEIGLLDKTQKMRRMMNILDAYIIRNTPSGGGSRKGKHKQARKTKKSRKIKKTIKTRKGKKSKKVR